MNQRRKELTRTEGNGVLWTLNQRVGGSSPPRLTIISMICGRLKDLPFFVCDKLVTSFLSILRQDFISFSQFQSSSD